MQDLPFIRPWQCIVFLDFVPEVSRDKYIPLVALKLWFSLQGLVYHLGTNEPPQNTAIDRFHWPKSLKIHLFPKLCCATPFFTTAIEILEKFQRSPELKELWVRLIESTAEDLAIIHSVIQILEFQTKSYAIRHQNRWLTLRNSVTSWHTHILLRMLKQI